MSDSVKYTLIYWKNKELSYFIGTEQEVQREQKKLEKIGYKTKVIR